MWASSSLIRNTKRVEEDPSTDPNQFHQYITPTSEHACSFKEAMVKPKVNKDYLDPEQYSNFNPISNLKFVSKITEKAVACQLKDYLSYLSAT